MLSAPGVATRLREVLARDVTRGDVVALAGFGWLKAKATGLPAMRGAVQTLLIGGLAAGVAYMVAKLVGG